MLERLSNWTFRWVHGHHLVYNTCWEDPRLDREALVLGPTDTIAMITSAGCNALDYALQGPKHIYAIDMNPRQNALLDLKIAAIKSFDYETFFQWFGLGRVKGADRLYRHSLRGRLSETSRNFWDKHIRWFLPRRSRRSFYFFGTTGLLAWMMNGYIDHVARLRDDIMSLFDSTSLAEQARRYSTNLHDHFWKGYLRWFLGRDTTLSLLGVPRAQRRQVETTYPGGIAKFIEDRIAAVFSQIPLADNYFWRVYLTGSYTPECCPEYLKPDSFAKLQTGLVDRISTHTGTLTNFFAKDAPEPISRFVLLDHMDWLNQQQLQAEWQAALDRAAPQARFLWRSGGLIVDYVDPLTVTYRNSQRQVGELLTYHTNLAQRLHSQDRVNTYGSFYIAELN